MIICHRYGFIFVKTRKTAGSSTEIALSRLCDSGDTITPLSARLGEEEMRAAHGGHPPANWAKRIYEHRGFREWKRLLTRRRRSDRFSQHATARELRDRLGGDCWDRYLTLTIERNPWDRAVSRYWWQKFRWERRGRTNFPGISDYLKYLAKHKPHWLTNWTHYAEGDQILVDRVLRYEQLAFDLVRLSRELGLPDDALELPGRRAKGGFRPQQDHYSQTLSHDDRRLIENLCCREIEAFDYRFEVRA
ncbi:MAG: sulfotransferase family 2 domain-containing protein [Halofilum sp. (in: g-proteobacteria)]